MSAASTIAAPEFTVALPESVIVRGTCEVEVTDQHLILRYAGRQFTLAGPSTLAGFAFAPLAEGRTLPTGNLPPHALRLLAKLASRGILADPDLPGAHDAASGASGINIVGCMTDEIFRLSEEIPSDTPANREIFLAGDFNPEWVKASTLEQYHFTNSADWHISPVLNHDLSSRSRAVWQQFLADELPHYRIWRPSFSAFGWNFAAVQRQIPREPTAWLIESCRGAAAHSELAYLGVILKLEAAPVESHYSESTYFSTLITKYGVPESAIKPLWWHAMENASAGHTTMPATLLSEHSPVSADQFSEAIWFLRRNTIALRDFNDELAASFGTSPGVVPDLS